MMAGDTIRPARWRPPDKRNPAGQGGARGTDLAGKADRRDLTSHAASTQQAPSGALSAGLHAWARRCGANIAGEFMRRADAGEAVAFFEDVAGREKLLGGELRQSAERAFLERVAAARARL